MTAHNPVIPYCWEERRANTVPGRCALSAQGTMGAEGVVVVFNESSRYTGTTVTGTLYRKYNTYTQKHPVYHPCFHINPSNHRQLSVSEHS